MKLPRRQFLRLAAGAAALPALSRIATAQTYPSRPIRWIVPFPAGGGSDIIARLMGQWLSERLGQPFVIENRAGAGSNLGTKVVVDAPPDGYTLLLAASPNAINATFYDSLNYNFIRDIAPVGGIEREPLVMMINPSFPAKTVPEFIAYAKANPGKVNMGSAGIGSTPHLAGEMFRIMAGVNLVHVPYRGSPQALTDLIGGQVQVSFPLVAGSVEYIRTGRLHAVAVTTARRSDVLPDVPAIAEFVPNYDASNWFGVGVPKKTPIEIVERLNKEVNAALSDPKVKTRLTELGGTPLALSPTEYGALIADETEKWGKVIRAANIKAE
jgi:tripartite-type tricarboxylate transporter receptor subunit TctC